MEEYTPIMQIIELESTQVKPKDTQSTQVQPTESQSTKVLATTSQLSQASASTSGMADGNVPVFSPDRRNVSTPIRRTALKNSMGPTKTRPRKQAVTLRKNAINYLTHKHEKDRLIREREVELEAKKLEQENRRLLLEEEKFKLESRRLEIEIREREEKLKMEKQKWFIEMEQKKVTSQLLLAQQQIINGFIKNKEHD